MESLFLGDACLITSPLRDVLIKKIALSGKLNSCDNVSAVTFITLEDELEMKTISNVPIASFTHNVNMLHSYSWRLLVLSLLLIIVSGCGGGINKTQSVPPLDLKIGSATIAQAVVTINGEKTYIQSRNSPGTVTPYPTSIAFNRLVFTIQFTGKTQKPGRVYLQCADSSIAVEIPSSTNVTTWVFSRMIPPVSECTLVVGDLRATIPTGMVPQVVTMGGDEAIVEPEEIEAILASDITLSMGEETYVLPPSHIDLLPKGNQLLISGVVNADVVPIVICYNAVGSVTKGQFVGAYVTRINLSKKSGMCIVGIPQQKIIAVVEWGDTQ